VGCIGVGLLVMYQCRICVGYVSVSRGIGSIEAYDVSRKDIGHKQK
jgi:hypothetical protein